MYGPVLGASTTTAAAAVLANTGVNATWQIALSVVIGLSLIYTATKLVKLTSK